MKARLFAVALLALGACHTVSSELGLAGGRVYRADLRTRDDAAIALWRWSPTDPQAPRVLVVPEVGFDHTLYAPLCERLRALGFDVALVEGRAVSGQNSGLSAWHRDVARALDAFGPARVLAIGVGGRAAFEVAAAREGVVRGIVAVNVPLQRADPNGALSAELARSAFDPKTWITRGAAPVLLATGHLTPRAHLDRLDASAVPLPSALAIELADWLADDLPDATAAVPVRAFASLKDNLVQPEQALIAPGLTLASARRMGRIELFLRDYGHLDWLLDEASLTDVVPVLAASLEALP